MAAQIVAYADHFVILCRGNATETPLTKHSDFLGYTFGP